MIAALAGIILVQVFWINNVIDQKEKLFDYQVNEALNSAADRVEKKLAIDLLGEHFQQIMHTDSMFTMQQMNDSLKQRVIEARTKNGITTYSYTETRVAVSPFEKQTSISGTLPNRPTIRLEPMELSGTLPEDVESMQKNLVPQIISEIDKQFQVNAGLMQKITEQMILEMMSLGIKPESKINMDFLKKAITNELQNRGINIDFNFGVLVDSIYFVIKPTSESFKNELLLTTHRTNLFPSDMFSKPDVLLVDFPGQKNYLFRSVSILVLGSLLFTAIIIAVFWYTIHILFKQKKLSEIKTDFINNMTHEFKTPLATISLAADAISNPLIYENKDRLLHYSHIIKEENKRMNSQVEKVLQMALLDKNQISLSKDEIDMHDIIMRAVENISLLVEEKGGSIKTELHADQFELIGDEVHLMNVVYNLLDNANKYSPEVPDIIVKTENNKFGIFVTVADKGIGMSQESIKLIFEKFYRVHTGNLHNVKGFGLGLAYVKAILDAHEGTIDVHSEPGKGSEFKIFIPFNS